MRPSDVKKPAFVEAVSRAEQHTFSKRNTRVICLHDELREEGFAVEAGAMVGNVTTRGVELPALPTGTRLRLGDEAIVEVTGLRNPCVQLDRFDHGLMSAVLDRDEDGNFVHKAGVKAVVVANGEVRP